MLDEKTKRLEDVKKETLKASKQLDQALKEIAVKVLNILFFLSFMIHLFAER